MTKVAELATQAIQLQIDAANATAKTLITPVYNVVGYGAKGDGVTDDTAAIQAAIDASELGGTYDNAGAVYIPPTQSFYRITGTLQMRRNTKIISDFALLIYEGTGTAISAEGTALNYIYPMIARLRIWKKNLDRIGTGVKTAYSTFGGYFYQVEVQGFEYGFYHSDTSWLNTFQECKSRQNKYGMFFGMNSNGVTVRECYLNSNDAYGITTQNANNVRIQNCEFEGNATTGSALIIDYSKSVLVEGCYMEQCGDPMIKVMDSTGTGYSYSPQIIGNYITGNNIKAIGIQLERCQDPIILGNKIWKFTTTGINVAATATRAMIDHNGITDNPTPIVIDPAAYSASSWIADHLSGFVGTAKFRVQAPTPYMELYDTNSSTFLRVRQYSSSTSVQRGSDLAEIIGIDHTGRAIDTAIKSGVTASRPASPRTGQMYYDTTIGKPIWYNGGWKDATGAAV